MTEEELMKTMCPHQARDNFGGNIDCLGADCSQYREKAQRWGAANQLHSPTEVPDLTLWKPDVVAGYYRRIKPLLVMDAWCGLAGVPHYAQS